MSRPPDGLRVIEQVLHGQLHLAGVDGALGEAAVAVDAPPGAAPIRGELHRRADEVNRRFVSTRAARPLPSTHLAAGAPSGRSPSRPCRRGRGGCTITSRALLLSVVMRRIAMLHRLLSHRGRPSSRWSGHRCRWGLVRMSTSPARAPVFVRTRSGWTKPVTARPYFGSSSSMLCPPVMIALRPHRPCRSRRAAAAWIVASFGIFSGTHMMLSAQLRLAAHGVDVRERIGRSDLAEGVGIVRDGREEVHRLHAARARPTTLVDRGVVALVEADQQIRVAVDA